MLGRVRRTCCFFDHNSFLDHGFQVALERAGRAERIDPRTLAEQAREALLGGDVEKATALSRAPEPKRGAGDGIQRRFDQGQGQVREPSRAVAKWQQVKESNARWQSECQQRSRKTGLARQALSIAARGFIRDEGDIVLANLTRLAVEAVVKRRGEAERPGPSSSSLRKKPEPSARSRRRKNERPRQEREELGAEIKRRRSTLEDEGAVIEAGVGQGSPAKLGREKGSTGRARIG